MTSLPMPTGWPDLVANVRVADTAGAYVGGQDGAIQNIDINGHDEQFLLRAFRSFAAAADSLERSYASLRMEVARLRRELEERNADLARSLKENCSMREHLDRILEGLPCGVLVTAGDGKISRVNPEALRLLELDQSVSVPASDAAWMGSISTLPAPIRGFLEVASRDTNEHELNIPGGVGTPRWLAVRHASIANGEAKSSVFIVRDVTERKRLEQVQAKLRREQALAEISALLAHEIRNPLGSLELFAGLLAEAELGPECRDWVERVQAGLRTLAATVNNVLHFHSLPEPECAPVDLGQLLDWARAFFAPLAHQSRIVLSFENHVAGIYLSADRHRMEQVILNLVLNALRAMPGGGWIELSGRMIRDGEAILLAVTDTGPGISPEHLSHIFEAGFSTRSGSPGLGLAVCRKIVEQHGGTIEVTSLPGRGAKFTMMFPVAAKNYQGYAKGPAA